MEQDLVRVMREQKVQLQKALEQLGEYTAEVEKMYRNENCQQNCAREVMMEKIVGNPIYSYQLLKRMHVYIKNVESALRDVDVKGKVDSKIDLLRAFPPPSILASSVPHQPCLVHLQIALHGSEFLVRDHCRRPRQATRGQTCRAEVCSGNHERIVQVTPH